jgi:Calcineurin-like phosphoesterase
MATIAVGDVHGNAAALEDLLHQLKGELARGDVLVFLGDYIDRGSGSKECIERIISFRDESAADVVCLVGNHDDWLLGSFRDHRRHTWLLATDAFKTIESYSREAAAALRNAVSQAGAALYEGECALPYELFFECVPKAHIQFFTTLRPYYQSEHCVCTHGGLDPAVPTIAAQTRHALIWGASGFPDRYEGPDIVVYGHRNNAVVNEDGWPLPAIVGPTIGIDTISHGVLTAIRMPERRLFQSARYGGRRSVSSRAD